MGEHRGAAPAIEVRGLTKRFGAHTAVGGVDLAVAPGTFFALLGPSGCGKTTTLRMIGGFETPTAGMIRLADEDVTSRPAHRRDVNTVFQSYALFPHLDVFSNVAFGLRRSRVSKAEVRARVGATLDLTELSRLERRKPAELSGGQQQRVALARALVNRPAALLLDEPLGALDLRLRRQLQEQLKRIQREVGITFLHVTHDQEEAMSMAEEIAVMAHGRIEQRGDAVTLYEQPRSRFVAGFLGACNLLHGAARTGRHGDVDVVFESEAVTAPAGRATIKQGAAVAGVRPEKIDVVSAGTPETAGANALAGRVISATFLGVSLQYRVQTASAEVIAVVPNRDREELPAPGDDVVVRWRREDTFVLPDSDDEATVSRHDVPDGGGAAARVLGMNVPSPRSRAGASS